MHSYWSVTPLVYASKILLANYSVKFPLPFQNYYIQYYTTYYQQLVSNLHLLFLLLLMIIFVSKHFGSQIPVPQAKAKSLVLDVYCNRLLVRHGHERQ